MTSGLVDRLKEFGKEMKDWDKKKTSVVGVTIVKLPSKGDDHSFGLEIIPVNAEGIPLKRRGKGLFITSLEQWEAFKDIFNNDKAHDLINSINEIRKIRVSAVEETTDEEVFEV
ncbi:MAG: hypothetical protein ACTSQF_03320 [Candidatus Heimdallarchaeaceae archaeon]